MAQKKTIKKITKGDSKTQRAKKAETSAKTSKKEEQTVSRPVNFIVLVLTFSAIGLLIFLSMIVNIVSHFNGETALLGYLTEPIMGLFGICTPAIGAYSIGYAYFCYKYRNDLSTKNAKGILLILNLVFLLGTLHLINTLWVNVPTNVKDLWNCGIHWQGCGVVGGYLGWFLSKLLHKSVGLVFGLLVYFVCLIFFCGGSPLDVLKSFAKRIKCFFRYVVEKTKKSFERRAFEKKEEETRKAYEKTPAVKPATTQKKTTYQAKEEEKPFEKEESREEPTPVSTYPKERTENYVTGSIYDAPIRKETSKEKTEEESSEIGEKVKNKFGFKMGREARDDGTAEVPSDDVSFEPDEKSEEEPIAITGEQTEIVPADSIETPVYITPPMDLLKAGDEETSFNSAEVEQKKRILLETLEAFKVKANVVNISCGPTITRYEIEPEIGVSVKSIEKLGKDLALRLAAKSLRIEAPIPGKCAVGIEVSNNDRLTVKLRDILDSPVFKEHKSKLFCCLGVDVAGNAVYLDIPKMPHLLIAGATGMGKSVCLNCLIVSLLYRATPDEVRLILIDPKKVEFSHYADIPHLLAPVVTNINKCAGTLNWAVAEMERRYDIFEAHSLRNLEEYQAQTADDPEAEKLASIVIVIDELADLMMQAKAEVETSICRLAQKARAAGMYLILGTQRPSVDVITGLIKANIPSRISLAVSSQVDSRTILDSAGAESLLDKGDILYAPAGARKALRVQGAFISTKELNSVCEFVRSNSKPQYDPDVVKNINTATENYGKSKKGKSDEDAGDNATDTKDLELMIAALEVGFDQGTVSTSYIQRRLSFGYAKAARVVDMLQQHGFVSAPDPVNKLRKILISPQELAELKMNGAISKKDEESE